MKITALLLATAGLAGTALAGDPQIDISQFDQAINQVRTLATKGQVTPSSFDEIRGSIYRISNVVSIDPEEQNLRDLLQQACDDLQARARESWVAETDFVQMREQVIAMWLDMHMQKLQRMARARGASREAYLAYAQQLGELARSWTPSRPDDAAYHQRVQSMIQNYVDRAQASASLEPIATTREQILHERCDRACATLERRARAGQGSRYDFTYVSYVLMATAEMQLAQNDPRALATIRERLNNAIAGLQPAEPSKPWLRVGAAPLEEMQAVRRQLKEAREASKAVEAGSAGR